MKTSGSLILSICCALLLTSCNPRKNEPLRIALSSATANYENWIHRSDSTVITINFDKLPIDSAMKLLASCDGLLLTGGEDVVPSYYGKTADSARCQTNPARDSLEFALIHKAMDLKMPILGICRGQQILNVAMGGTLVIDIPSDHPSVIAHKCEDYTKCFHHVTLENASNLRVICRADTGWVTSNHHQAVDKVATLFRVAARSPDSIIEAIEYTNPSGKPFLQAVQWHPERMAKGNALSDPLIDAFLQSAAKKHANSRE